MTTTTMSSVSVERLQHLVDRVLGCTPSSRTGCPTVMPAGELGCGCPVIASRTRWMTSSELAVGSTQMPMKVAAWPLKRTSWS